MRLELVGGRYGQGQAGDPHPGSGHDSGAVAAGAGVAGTSDGSALDEQLAEAERRVSGVRERLQALVQEAAALREQLGAAATGDAGGSAPPL